jgi:hypothetical protein
VDRPPNLLQLKITYSTDRMKDTQELTTNTKNSLLGTVRQARVEGSPGGFLQPELEFPKVNTSFPLPDLPNQPRESYQIIGEDETSLGDAIHTNL